MATKKAKASSAGLKPDSGVAVPRMSLAETGFIGLRTASGRITEEMNNAFRFPQFFRTVDEMRANGTINAALNIYRMMMMQAQWTVKAPEDADDTDKARAEFIQSCMHDMENSWPQVMAEIITYLEYGYSIQEKVFRRRFPRNGSKYNDGLVGLRKISPRAQNTITKWYFSEDGRDLEGIGQNLSVMEYGARFQALASNIDGLIRIDRNKFMLFSADSVKSNPEGKSILKSVYLPYKQLTMLIDQLLLGVAKDLSSVPVVKLPPKYMDVNASPEDAAVYKEYQKLVDNVAAGTQRGIIIPQIIDPDTKQPLFDFSLLEAKGTNKFDLPGIIDKFQKEIFTTLQIDVLGLDKAQANFTMRESLCAIAVRHRLNEIKEVLNKDLIPQLYALNGWSQEKLPTFEYGEFLDINQETLSKSFQRVASVGLLEMDRQVLNRVRDMLGIEQLHPDTEIDKDNLTMAASRSGDSMEKGKSGDQGTSDISGKGTKQDTHSNNSDNTG